MLTLCFLVDIYFNSVDLKKTWLSTEWLTPFFFLLMPATVSKTFTSSFTQPFFYLRRPLFRLNLSNFASSQGNKMLFLSPANPNYSVAPQPICKWKETPFSFSGHALNSAAFAHDKSSFKSADFSCLLCNQSRVSVLLRRKTYTGGGMRQRNLSKK